MTVHRILWVTLPSPKGGRWAPQNPNFWNIFYYHAKTIEHKSRKIWHNDSSVPANECAGSTRSHARGAGPPRPKIFYTCGISIIQLFHTEFYNICHWLIDNNHPSLHLCLKMLGGVCRGYAVYWGRFQLTYSLHMLYEYVNWNLAFYVMLLSYSCEYALLQHLPSFHRIFLYRN